MPFMCCSKLGMYHSTRLMVFSIVNLKNHARDAILGIVLRIKVVFFNGNVVILFPEYNM